MTVEDVARETQKYPCRNISITGGEPLLQRDELIQLVSKLKTTGYSIRVNTNGTIFVEEIFDAVDLITMDCKCPSSGMSSNEAVLDKTKKFYDQKTQFKFVIYDEIDYKYAKNVLCRLKPEFAVFQPNWKDKNFVKQLVELVKNDGLDARVILQQHKLIWGVRKRL
jgi:7-carboxy-7-deazaguanine synthase